jgi:hypothetical protein
MYVCLSVLKGHLLPLNIGTKTSGAQSMDLEEIWTKSPKISECFQHTNLYTHRLCLYTFINDRIAVAIGTCCIKLIRGKLRYLV